MLVLSVGHETDNFICRTLEINCGQCPTDNDFLFSVLQTKQTFYGVAQTNNPKET
jgi:hypothetical protein